MLPGGGGDSHALHCPSPIRPGVQHSACLSPKSTREKVGLKTYVYYIMYATRAHLRTC